MITVLSPQGAVRGSYVNNMPESTPFFDDVFTDNLETMETSLRFSVPLESPDSEWLEGFSTVLYPDKDNNLRELTVIEVWEDWSRDQPVKQVVCEDASIDSLLKTHTAPFVAGSLEEAIHGALAASEWEFQLAADTANIGYNLIEVKEYSNVRDVLETIRQAYDVEYRFNVVFDGANIRRRLHVYKQFGQRTGKYFIYDRDLDSIERTIDFSNVFTAALPYWMEDDSAQTIAGYTPRNPIAGFRKDYTMDYVQHLAAHDEFDTSDHSRMLIFKASSNNPELAYLEACNKLLDYISPTYTYTVSVKLLNNVLGFEGTEEIHLGDYVWLKEKVGEAELGLEARVIQLTSSHSNPEQDEVTFTNFKEISTADSDEVNALRDLIKQIQDQQEEITEVVNQTTEDISILQQGQAGIIEQLGDVPTVSVGNTPNPNPKEGDIWFLDAVDPETGKTYSTIRIWNDALGDWQDRYSAKDAEEAQAAADEAAQAGKDAQAAADAAKEAAQDATAAGQAALDKANQAATDAAAAKDQADAIKVDVDGLQTSVANAQADATKALGDVADALAEIGQVDGKVTDIKTSVDGLTVTVGEVKTTADSALSKATQVSTTVDGLKVTIASVQEWQDNFGVGGRNWVKNSASPHFIGYQGASVTYAENQTVTEWNATNAVKHTVSGGTNATVVGTIQSGILPLANKGTNYVHSIYIKNIGTTNVILDNNFSKRVTVAPNEAKRVVLYATSQAATNQALQFVLIRTAQTDVLEFIAWHAQIEEGTVVTDWTPAPEDMATVTQVTQIEATVNGLKTTVGEVKTTADSALSKATTVEQTASGLTTTVAEVKSDLSGFKSTTSTQIQQLSDNINLKVDKNGIIAQINVSSEGILIDGKYTHITGTTTIDNAVIKTAHIADLAVSNAKIANLAVNGAKIADAAITTAKIGDLQVSTAKIANLAVTDAKIGSLSASKITTGTLDAGKISVINLSASSITSGTLSGLTIQSPYDRPITEGATTWQRGTLTLTNGLYTNEWETYVKATGVKNISGKLVIDHQSLSSYQLDSSGKVEYNMQLSPYSLTLQTGDGKGGSLSYNDLYSRPKTSLMPASGWSQYSNDPNNGNHPTVTRQGRMVTLAGAFANNNELPATNDSYTVTTIPEGFRPAQLVKWISKGSGTSIFMITVEANGRLYINYRLGSAGGGFGYVVNASGNIFNLAGSYSAADV